MAWLSVQGISKKEKEIFTVRQVSFDQDQFQKIAIAGETGSGKTTLLRMIAGFVQPDQGEIYFKGERVKGPFEKLIPGHPEIAYLSQHFELRNNYTVAEELEAVNLLTAEDSRNIFEVCRIGHLLNRKTNELSGGERQRIVLARQLVTAPKLLLLDEPYSNLDGIHRNIIRSAIREIGSRLNTTCIMILHDAADLLSWAETILIMRNGQLVQQGSPEQVYYYPVDKYCASVLGEYNLLDKNSPIISASPLHTIGNKVMVRPEQFKIELSTEGNAEIAEVMFAGSYYTLLVKAGEETINVRVINNRFSPGDRVKLILPNN